MTKENAVLTVGGRKIKPTTTILVTSKEIPHLPVIYHSGLFAVLFIPRNSPDDAECRRPKDVPPFFPFLPGSQRSCLFLSVTQFTQSIFSRPVMSSALDRPCSLTAQLSVFCSRDPAPATKGNSKRAVVEGSRSVGIQSQRSCRARKRLLPWRAG